MEAMCYYSAAAHNPFSFSFTTNKMANLALFVTVSLLLVVEGKIEMARESEREEVRLPSAD